MNPGSVAVGFLHPGEWSACFGLSLVELYLVDATIGSHRLVRQLPKFCAAGGVVAARNEVAEKFLDATDCEWLWMIDSDMGFGPTTVDELIAAADPDTRPVVGGLCFALRRDRPGVFHGEKYVIVPSAYRWIETGGEVGFQSILDLPSDETLMEVSATGAACMLVHRNALDAVRKKYGDHWFDPVTHPTGPTTFSEDLSFCVRLAAVDIPVFVHTGVGTTHDKGGIFLDREAFDTQAGISQARAAVPTYAVVASKDRPEMLATLRSQLAGQVTDMFVFDNGYTTPPPGVIEAHGWPLHRMWNTGLDMAEKAAEGSPFNVLVINDDVEVGAGFCAQLAVGLRSDDDNWIAYPNWRGLDLAPGEVVPTTTEKKSGQTMSGWAFMLRGEAGLRLDERYQWWYADSDLERRVRAAGKHTVCVGGCHARHLDPLRSTVEDPERIAQVEADEKLFAERWGV